MKFSSNVAGSVTGIRFYKGPGNAGAHVGHLWSGSGQLLASANFTSETASGWQQVNFATPVAIKPNTTYVASYLAPVGRYSANGGYFASSYANGPLRVPANGGVYKYGTKGGFPTQTWNATNYWVDLVLAANTAPKAAAPDSTAGTTSSIIPPSPDVARTAFASSSSPSPTIPTGETYPTSAGVDQVFAVDDGSYLPNIPGVRRKSKRA